MTRSDLTQEAWEFLSKAAPTAVWWKSPEKSLEFPQQVLAGVMDTGTFEEAATLRSLVSLALLQEVLSTAEPGQFRPRSWSYWHWILNGYSDAQVPPEPARAYR